MDGSLGVCICAPGGAITAVRTLLPYLFIPMPAFDECNVVACDIERLFFSIFFSSFFLFLGPHTDIVGSTVHSTAHSTNERYKHGIAERSRLCSAASVCAKGKAHPVLSCASASCSGTSLLRNYSYR